MKQEAESWRQGGYLPDAHEAAQRTPKADDKAPGGPRGRYMAGTVDERALPQIPGTRQPHTITRAEYLERYDEWVEPPPRTLPQHRYVSVCQNPKCGKLRDLVANDSNPEDFKDGRCEPCYRYRMRNQGRERPLELVMQQRDAKARKRADEYRQWELAQEHAERERVIRGGGPTPTSWTIEELLQRTRSLPPLVERAMQKANEFADNGLRARNLESGGEDSTNEDGTPGSCGVQLAIAARLARDPTPGHVNQLMTHLFEVNKVLEWLNSLRPDEVQKALTELQYERLAICRNGHHVRSDDLDSQDRCPACRRSFYKTGKEPPFDYDAFALGYAEESVHDFLFEQVPHSIEAEARAAAELDHEDAVIAHLMDRNNEDEALDDDEGYGYDWFDPGELGKL